MRLPRSRRALLAALLAPSLLVLGSPSASADTAAPLPTAPLPTAGGTGLLVVGFASGIGAGAQAAAVRDSGADAVSAVPRLSAVVVRAGSAQADWLRAAPGVRYVEPYAVRTAASDADTPERAELRIAQAQSAVPSFDGRGEQVAVLDTGVDAANHDLAGRVVAAGDYSSGVRQPGGGTDNNGHGTGVAALIAAAADGSGIVGTAPAATVRSYKVLDADGSGGSVGLALAIRQVADDAAGGAPIVAANMSLGGPFLSRVEADALAYAAQRAPQVLFVAAAGNDGGDRPSYPAAEPGVLSVGASQHMPDGTWQRAPFSNTADVDVLAPGVDVLTYTYNPASEAPHLGLESGTSEATPLVTGLVADLAASGGLTGQAAATAVKASARPLDAASSFPPGVGSGRADALALSSRGDGTHDLSSLFTASGTLLDGGSERTVVTQHYVPRGGPGGAAVLTASGGAAVQAGPTATSTAGPGLLVTTSNRLLPPRGGAGSGTLTATDAAGGADSIGWATVPASEGEHGQPVRPGQVLTASLGTARRTALLASFPMHAGQSLTLRGGAPAGGPPLSVWAPGPGGRASSTFGDADQQVDASRLPRTYVAPLDGTYVAGWVLDQDSGQGGAYALAADYPTPTARTSAPAVSATSTAGLPFRVRWSGGSSYTVQWMTRTRSADGWRSGPWRPWLAGTRATSALFGAAGSPTPVAAGTTYWLRAIATDDLGAVGAPSPAVATAVPYDDGGPGIAYGPGWHEQRATGRYLGTLHSTDRAGAGLRVDGEARTVALVGDRCPACGQLRVVFGGRTTTVDTGAGSTLTRQVLWTGTVTSAAARAFTLSVTAVGTQGRPVVRLDGVAVNR